MFRLAARSTLPPDSGRHSRLAGGTRLGCYGGRPHNRQRYPAFNASRPISKNTNTAIEPDSWDLIVCWLYWQPDLLPEIARGVREGGVVALAGKTSGRFATSLAQYREAFDGWTEIASGENESRAFFDRPAKNSID